jgi:outer membrane biosynthesis protein TonB
MTTREEIENKDRIKAGVLAFLIFAGLIVLCIFMTAFSIQDPPPGDQFVAVGMADFGDSADAGGDSESEVPSEEVQEVVEEAMSQSSTVETNTAEEIVTQETSDVSTPTSTKTEKTDPVEPEKTVSSGLSSILDKINDTSGGGGSEGTTSGTGNQGDPNGNIDGKGVVQGEGIGWALSGRGMVGQPKLSEKPKEKGKVVLDIRVDRDGKVTSTDRNYNLSTTTSDYLFTLAEKAAKTARFSVKKDAPPSQLGSMTFLFELK